MPAAFADSGSEDVVLDYRDGHQVERDRDAGLELVGPYKLIAQIAGGDFTSVHLAQKEGALGFHRLAAIKRLKPEFQKQPEWTQLLLDEARLSAVVRHPNIVDIIDVGTDTGVYIVMDYIEGADLDILIERAGKERHPRYLVPPIVDALTGLHAVHTAHDELGESLAMVHQAPRARHILIGIDGVSRITDFSQVSARGLIPSTLRGKRLAPGYMAPEQVLVSEPVSARTDVFIAGITLWETLTGARLFHADTPSLARRAITERHIPRPSEVGLKPPRCFDDICMRALQRNPEQRYQSALEMAHELHDAALNESLYASASELGLWVRALASRALVERRRALGADAPSQEIQLDAPEGPTETSSVQIAFGPISTPISTQHTQAAMPFGQPRVEAMRPPGFGSAPRMSASETSREPTGRIEHSVAQVMPEPIADDPSRVSRSHTVPVTTPRPRRASISPNTNATLMGLSPSPRASSLPPPALAATMGYGSVVRGRASGSQVAQVETNQAPAALPGRRTGAVPANATLPEGALLRDLNLPSRPPARAPSHAIPAVQVRGSFATEAAQPERPAQTHRPAQTERLRTELGLPPSRPMQAAAPSELHVASVSAEQARTEQARTDQARAPHARAEQASGSFPMPRDGFEGPTLGHNGMPPRHPTSDGVVPADIFARVQAAQREATESFRPPAFDSDFDWEHAEPPKRGRLASLLTVAALLALGGFGYRFVAGAPERVEGPVPSAASQLPPLADDEAQAPPGAKDAPGLELGDKPASTEQAAGQPDPLAPTLAVPPPVVLDGTDPSAEPVPSPAAEPSEYDAPADAQAVEPKAAARPQAARAAAAPARPPIKRPGSARPSVAPRSLFARPPVARPPIARPAVARPPTARPPVAREPDGMAPIISAPATPAPRVRGSESLPDNPY